MKLLTEFFTDPKLLGISPEANKLTRKPRLLFLRAIMFGAIAITLASCSDKSNTPPKTGELSGRINIVGSSTVAPLVSEMAKQFESMHPGVRVDVQSGGSSMGIASVKQGTADIGMISRALKPDEQDLAATTIALDGVSLIINAGNKIPELSDANVVAIYTGKIKKWSDVGGSDAEVTVVNKAEGRSTLELFLNHYKLKNEEIKPKIVIGENMQGILTVAADPNAIGYVSIGTAEFEVSNGRAIRLLPMAGVDASVANVKNGKFPLSRPLNLVTTGEVSPLAQAFLDFARSRQVDHLVEAQFFVPVAR